MPALVNFGGDDDFYSSRSFCTNPMELDMLYSMGSSARSCYSPCKRARLSASFFLSKSKLELKHQPSIEILPDEILVEIFKRLPGDTERSSCVGVSKRWLKLLSSIRRAEFHDVVHSSVSDGNRTVAFDSDGDVHLTRCLEGKKATDIRLAAIAVGTSGRGGLAKLSIRGSDSVNRVSDFGLSAIARGCPSLRSLSLWKVPSVGDEGLLAIARECHMLEKLDLCQCPSISDKSLIAIAESCPSLVALSIESCSRIGNEALQAVGKYCPKLQSISVKDCPLVGDRGVSTLLVSASSILSSVTLQGLNITDFSLAVVGLYGKAVAKIFLSDLQNVSEKGFWVMGHAQGLKRLTSLEITSCPGVTDLSFGTIGKCCTSLKQIVLRRCCLVTDNGLVAFAKAAESLEVLKMAECHRVTQHGILGVLTVPGSKLKSLGLEKCTGVKDQEFGHLAPSSCTSLKSLSIRDCPRFGNAMLAMLARLCPHLEKLDLTGSYGVTDSGLLRLLESSTAGLVDVSLCGCFNLTDRAITALARHHGETIEVLNLDGCRRITDASLVAISDHCLFLSDLDVSKCSITDHGIAAMSHSGELNLQVLSLSGCSELSDKISPFLRKMGRTLVGLNLQNCSSIGGATVDLLTESLWRCDILS